MFILDEVHMDFFAGGNMIPAKNSVNVLDINVLNLSLLFASDELNIIVKVVGSIPIGVFFFPFLS